MKKLTTNELREYGKNIIFALGCTFLCVSFFSIVMQKLDVSTFRLISGDGKIDKGFIYGCVFAPICEEVIFRWLPIMFLMKLIGNKKFDNVKWYVAGLLAIIFGAAHYGYFSIYVQGIAGFFITYVYYHNRKCMYLSGVIVHMAWNFSLSYTLPVMINFPNTSFW